MSQWIDAVKGTSLNVLVPAVGLTLGRLGSFGPCPGCSASVRGSDDRRGPCGMAKDLRGWDCKRCQIRGDAVDLLAWVKYGCSSSELSKDQWGELRERCLAQGWASEADTAPSPSSAPRTQRPKATLTHRLLHGGDRPARERAAPPAPAAETPSGGPFAWRDGLAEECSADLWDPGSRQSDTALQWLREERKLADPTIKAWGLGVRMIQGSPWLAIPLRDESERIVNIRFRSLPPAEKTYRVCPGRPLPLFGSHNLGNDLAQVVITEGELDVIALWQYGLTTSVVSGTAGSDTMKPEWLDQLEAYEGFVLCYDNDEAGERGAAKFAEKMGVERCSRAVLPCNDAGQCLIEGIAAESIHRVIERASPMFGVAIKRVSAYTNPIERLIANPDELKGRPTGSDKIDACLGGLRPGVIIVSGDTGHGKTTFAHWLLWVQASMGVPVLTTSFEQRPIGSVQKFLRMQLGGDFTRVDADVRKEALAELGEMPIHVLDHYGEMPAEQLFRTLRYCARRLGIKVALIDHLGFLIDPLAEDKVGQIESIIRALAIVSETLGITTILVCHPKGLPQGQKRVTINDIKGASAIKQDASSVVIVERAKEIKTRKHPASWLHFDKVRSEFGVPGSRALMAFGPLSCCYADNWESTPEGRSGALITG